LPLLAAAVAHRSLRGDGPRPLPDSDCWEDHCLAAYGLAAVAACDLHGQLAVPAAKLLALAAQLRSKQAAMVVERLLNEDAVLPAALRPAMGDRSARRLFARLVLAGAVRQLRELNDPLDTRLYGL
jgi:hypothetical protein